MRKSNSQFTLNTICSFTHETQLKLRLLEAIEGKTKSEILSQLVHTHFDQNHPDLLSKIASNPPVPDAQPEPGLDYIPTIIVKKKSK